MLMPSYRVHLVGGAATYVVVAQLSMVLPYLQNFSLPEHAIFLAVTLVGSLFPDIDIASKMQNNFFKFMPLALPLALFYSINLFVILGFACVAALVVRHRTITHQIWFLVLIPALYAFIMAHYYPSHSSIIFAVCTYFSAGALSHRLLDFGPRRFFSRKR